MIICDFDFMGVAVFPDEANAILAIDSNAVLSFPVPPQGLQVMAGNNRQVIEEPCPVQVGRVVGERSGRPFRRLRIAGGTRARFLSALPGG
jgi:hypothetical protein